MFSLYLAVLFLALLSFINAQQIYIPTNGPTPRPTCPVNATRTPTFKHTPFYFTQSETVRTATSIAAPATTHTYAAAYAALSTLVPSLSTTSWGNWNPNTTATATDSQNAYGQAAWTSQWARASPFLPNFTYTSLYSTTVSPTPIPTSELVLPPPEYFVPQDCYNFPDGFMFGVAGSAAQIEGAVAQEGRAPTLMEVLAAPGQPSDYVTNENYYYYKQDIERIAAMGVKYYSFTIPWARILPFVLPGTPVNSLGLQHYDDLINFVLSKGMVPTVTLIHFDTPLIFYGNISTRADPPEIGYVNGAYQNETFEDAFVNYAKIVMTHYADRVPVWFT